MRELDPPATLPDQAARQAFEKERRERAREEAVQELRSELARSEGDLAQLARHNRELARELAEVTEALAAITGSRAYPVLLRLWRLHHALAPEGSERERQLFRLLDAAGFPRHATFGPTALLAPAAAPQEIVPPAAQDPYEAWLEVNPFSLRLRQHIETRLAGRTLSRISVVLPVFNPPSAVLDAAIESVRAQVYGNWELCIADDASPNRGTRRSLAEWARRDPRIRVAYRKERGNVSAASNTAASLATGDFLVFLDHDDLLTPDALAEVALHLAETAETDVLYSDEDRLDLRGRRCDPKFKPDWSPELLLSFMYLGHLWGLRRRLFHETGGFRPDLSGSQDHDLALRATERSRHVAHLPLVLYHWRAIAGSMAVAASEKPGAFEAGRRAVEDALARRGVPARVYRPAWAQRGDLGLFEPEFPDDGPPVTLVIPTRNRADLLRPCLAAVRATRYRNQRVLVVDDESDDPATLALLRGLRSEQVLRLPRQQDGFNFAALCNRAARAASGEYLVFLNDDTRVAHPRWLSQMMGYAQMAGVGAVGARLLYANGRVQHAGVVHGLHQGLAGHAFSGWPAEDHGYLFGARAARNCSAVTAACLLTPRRLFLESGGFDEAVFPVAYNDADYGYRLGRAGLRSVFCASAELFHAEGASRGHVDDPRARAEYRRRFHGFRDPYLSPHLSREDVSAQIVPRCLVRGGRERVRALLWTHALDWTGAPLHQLEVASALQDEGLLSASVMSHVAGPLADRYQAAGMDVEVHPLDLTVDITPDDYEARVEDLTQALRKRAPDVVYVNTLGGFPVVEAASRAGVSSVWNIHESDPWDRHLAALGPTLAPRALDAFSKPYRVVFVSEASRRAFAPLDAKHRFCVVPNGLPPDARHEAALGLPREEARQALGLAPRDVVFLLVGTVCARKGQHDLAAAFSALGAHEAEDARCIFVGDRDGEYSRELGRIVDSLPARRSARVWRLPERPDTAPFYRAADVFVCTSRLESYPRVILEAMAYGLPIVTTPVFGIREQVQDNVNALFYTPGDVYGLADILARLTLDAGLRARLASRSRDVLASLPGFADMIAAYGEMLREAPLATPSQ